MVEVYSSLTAIILNNRQVGAGVVEVAINLITTILSTPQAGAEVVEVEEMIACKERTKDWRISLLISRSNKELFRLHSRHNL